MTRRLAILLAFSLAASAAGAQIYRWTDEKGRVHYGEKPPAGQKPERIVKPPHKPSPEDVERQRRLDDQANREMYERDAREAAALRNSAAGVYRCNELERYLRDAQSGELVGASGERRRLSEAEQKSAIEALTAERNRHCR